MEAPPELHHTGLMNAHEPGLSKYPMLRAGLMRILLLKHLPHTRALGGRLRSPA